jgi:hypothetical protein
MTQKADTLAIEILGCLLLCTATPRLIQAQQYVISTVAGEALRPPPPPVLSVDLSIRYPLRVATDAQGNASFTTDNYVFKGRRSDLARRCGWQARRLQPRPSSNSDHRWNRGHLFRGRRSGASRWSYATQRENSHRCPAGGYVPVVLQVGDASTTPGAVWIAVAGN